MVRVLLTGLLLLTAGSAQDKNPLHGNKDAIEAGKGMFRIYCAPCHGIAAQGGRGPDLTLGSYTAGNEDASLYRVIANGVAGTEMPGYSDRFDSDGIWRVVSYIRSVAGRPAPPLTGNRAAGEKLFWGKGACGACHRLGMRGSRIAPDLTLVGRTRSVEYLKEALVAPNASITPGYNTITIVTKEGKKIAGVQRNYDAFSAQVMDAQENYHSFFRDEVRSMERSLESMMPSYAATLSPRELDDMLAFLASLRGKGDTQ